MEIKLKKWLDDLFIDSKDTKKLEKTLFIILIVAVLMIIGVFSYDVAVFTEGKYGEFGDFFGGVLNPIFTFLTLFGLIVTIVIQRQELRLARREYEKTATALNTQAIEVTFFNVIDLHHKIADSLELDLSKIEKASKIELALTEFANYWLKKKTVNSFIGRPVFDEILEYLSSSDASPTIVVERYSTIQNEHNYILGHYFRNLYQALKLIDSHKKDIVTEKNKRKYASILRSQLSSKELALLFVNCLEGVSDSGQFKNLLIEYSMLEHLPIKKVSDDCYLLAGTICVDKAMLAQYRNKIDFSGLDFQKYYSGAFGKNTDIPYKLD
ncbi:hypothetical protein AN168_13410 [Vibrio splendidus]|uniref:Phage abortive infection protein n=1 Tax=Vibrio splendidus TaxID=29497 RepID=A0A837NUN5_VIBSP|nr:hypothetical protein AN168_13410 [Vibrio splendidus]